MTDTNSLYLIWSNEHKAWWRPASAGYTYHMQSAGRYSRDEALEICKGANRGLYHGQNPEEIPVLEADAILCMKSEERPVQRKRFPEDTHYDNEGYCDNPARGF